MTTDHSNGEHTGHATVTGAALNRLAISATTHCLTGCGIGEVLGLAIATALGWGAVASIALAVVLAFVFGYALTLRPLLKSGIAFGAAAGLAFAADTLSITVMEIVDNAIILLIPGAMDAGLTDLLFWGSLAFSLFVAFLVTLLVPAEVTLISMFGARIWPISARTSTTDSPTSTAGLPRCGGGWSGRVGQGGRDLLGSALDGPGEQQPGPADLGPVAQPPAAVLPAGQALTLEAAGGQRGVLAGDRQGGPVFAGSAVAAEPQDAVVDAPDVHAVAAGVRLGFHQDRTVGHHPGVVALLDRANFRGQPVQPVPQNGFEHFFHVPSIGQERRLRQ